MMTHRVPVRQAIRPATHLHPADWFKKPAIMGPIDGPRKGAIANIAIAIPRSLALNISAMTPPALVRGDDPKVPAKARMMIKAAMFGAPAVPALKAANAI